MDWFEQPHVALFQKFDYCKSNKATISSYVKWVQVTCLQDQFLICELGSCFSQRELWGWVNSKSVTVGRGAHGVVVRAEMFGQLTSGLEAAWNKLKGEGSVLALHLHNLTNYAPMCDETTKNELL